MVRTCPAVTIFHTGKHFRTQKADYEVKNMALVGVDRREVKIET